MPNDPIAICNRLMAAGWAVTLHGFRDGTWACQVALPGRKTATGTAHFANTLPEAVAAAATTVDDGSHIHLRPDQQSRPRK